MIKVGIVGGTGYTGVELLRLLAQHEHAQVQVITSRAEAGKGVAELFPNLRGHYDLAFSVPDVAVLTQCDVVFFATPHGVAQSMMRELVDGGVRVIDLSADFRIRDIDTWEHWYGQTHQCPDLAGKAVYGLPELNREKIKSAQLIACPGCYPTSVALGLMPLVENNLVDPSSLIASCASGASGAGRQANSNFILAETVESYHAYAASGHRHLPEIEQTLGDMQAEGASQAQLTFVPHLLPTVRGIHATLYAKLTGDASDIQALYQERYANEAFVDVLPAGVYPQTRSVRASNVCRLSVVEPQDRGMLVVMSVIDNLTKGASGQGVQNMNIMFGFDEKAGLQNPAVLP